MKHYESRVDMSARRQIAEAQLGLLRFQNPSNAYCQCPGVQFHTGKPGKRDCRVALEGVPTIHCLHTSCLGAVQEANKRLRSEIAKAELIRSGGDNKARGVPAPPGSRRKPTIGRVVRAGEAFHAREVTSARTPSDGSDDLAGFAPYAHTHVRGRG